MVMNVSNNENSFVAMVKQNTWKKKWLSFTKNAIFNMCGC